MQIVKIAFLASAIACSSVTVSAQEAANVAPQQDGTVIVPRVTPTEIVTWGQSTSVDWMKGYSEGMTQGVAKTMEILSRLNLVPFRICFQGALTNGQLRNAIWARMSTSTIPLYGGNADNWDQEAITQIAIATIDMYPCP